jgi:hypothetical protein
MMVPALRGRETANAQAFRPTRKLAEISGGTFRVNAGLGSRFVMRQRTASCEG